jgi:adenylate kinase
MQEGVAKNICLFGPQGSGKGTQAEKLSAWLGLPHVSPGNIFRKAVADHTDLGTQVEAIINAGKLVPNDVTNALMRERLQQEDALMGFILDGYPRNEEQAVALDSMTNLTHVFVIDIPDDETIRRISRRRVCTSCGATYHLEFKPPMQTDICDNCGSALILRDDDQPEAIRQRLAIYHAETEPVFSRYEQRGILHRVHGVGSIEQVFTAVQERF